jgi:hypothetical protein
MASARQLRAALAAYVAELERGITTTRQPHERGRYQQHLAAAASMFAALEHHRSLERLKQLVVSERRAYGWDMLSGPAGVAAEQAFDAFAVQVEAL